jgi:GNAT superfamily N-acetyltransferase
MNVTIRRALLGDESLLAELNSFVHELHVTNDPAYFKPAVKGEVAAWFRELLEKPSVRIWIAEDAHEGVGYVSTLHRERAENPFSRSRRWLEIDHIGVRPDYRRRGVGRALIEVALQAAKSGGIRDVELNSWVFNSGAHEAFRRLGFTPKVVRLGRESSRP